MCSYQSKAPVDVEVALLVEAVCNKICCDKNLTLWFWKKKTDDSITTDKQTNNAQTPVSYVVPLPPYSRNRCGEQSWLFYEKLSTEKLSADVLSGCQLKEKSKVYDGTHLQTIRWSSLEGCAAACAEKNACSVFYFNNFVFKRCYLYGKGEIRNTTSSVTAGFCPKGMTLEFQITFDVFQGDPIKE